MTATLVFDGDCGFCTTSARWLERRLPAERGVVVVAGQRAQLVDLGLTPDDVATAAWWVDGDGTRLRGHRAVGRAFEAMGGPWPVLGLACRVPPAAWLAAGVYALVARFRYRLPGGTPACRI